MLELVGIGAHADRYPHQLSGGQQQRVALARALAIQPQVLLLDEPLSALDAKVRVQLRDEIRRIQLEVGTTTLFVTHDQEEALAIADRVGVMRAGRLEQIGPPRRRLPQPGDAVRRRVRRAEQPAARAGSPAAPSRCSAPGCRWSTPADASATVRSRRWSGPESVDVTADPAGAGRVLAASFLGPTARVTVALPGDTLVVAQVASARLAELPPGTPVRVELRPVPVVVSGDRSETADPRTHSGAEL